eukprot:6198802-Pleurochrysis_carterae.AAC.1
MGWASRWCIANRRAGDEIGSTVRGAPRQATQVLDRTSLCEAYLRRRRRPTLSKWSNKAKLRQGTGTRTAGRVVVAGRPFWR